jgi:hypothetical protein
MHKADTILIRKLEGKTLFARHGVDWGMILLVIWILQKFDMKL